MKIASLKHWSPLFVLLITLGCSIDNDNDTKCIAKDCAASCIEAGRQGGTCKGASRCTCAEEAPIPYKWNESDTQRDSEGTDSQQSKVDSGDSDTIMPTDRIEDAGDTAADAG